MANVYGVRPISLDTFSGAIDVGSTLFGSSTAKLKVNQIVWESPAATSDTCTITDGNGYALWTVKCDVAKGSYTLDIDSWVEGIKIGVSGVTSGTIKIFLD